MVVHGNEGLEEQEGDHHILLVQESGEQLSDSFPPLVLREVVVINHSYVEIGKLLCSSKGTGLAFNLFQLGQKGLVVLVESVDPLVAAEDAGAAIKYLIVAICESGLG